MTGFGARATVIAGRLAAVACAALLVGCGSASDEGAGSAVDGPSQTAPSTEEGSAGGSADDAGVGDCVQLGGTEDDATIEVVDCASDQATSIVAAAVGGSDECPGDVDSTYYEELVTVETLALCLDVNWRPDTCYDLTDSTSGATIAPCAVVPGREIVRFEQRIDGATDVDGCASGGYLYPDRAFAICVSTVE